jgi:hypothetical protein
MILSPFDLEIPSADVCIVGAGPVGLALTFALEQQGRRVLLLETGSVDGRLPASQHDIAYANEHHAALVDSNGAGLGGTSSLWGGRCVAFDDLDFEPRAYVPHSGWPISHSALSNYYPAAFRFLDCSRTAPPAPEIAPEMGDVDIGAIEYWSKQPSLKDLYRARIEASKTIFFVPDIQVTTLITSSPDHSRVESLVAERNGKTVSIVAPVFALACGGLGNTRLMLQLQEALPPDRKISDALGRYYQGHLTGYIAVAQFDHDAAAAMLMFETDNDGRQVRRRFQIGDAAQRTNEILNTVFWADAISIADPRHHSSGLSALYLLLKCTGLYRRISNGNAAGSTSRDRANYRRHFENLRPKRYAFGDYAHTITSLFAHSRDRKRTLRNPARRYLLRYHAEQIPHPDSRVSLGNLDGGARQVLSVDYRVQSADISSVLRAHTMLDAWLRRNGIGHLEYLHDSAQRFDAVNIQSLDGFHQIGLARMGNDTSTSVTDRDCKVHGLSNLYLAGSCLFPTSGQANPTLPAVALAFRLGDHLATRKHHDDDHTATGRDLAY